MAAAPPVANVNANAVPPSHISEELLSVKIKVDSKIIFAALCENVRGRFLKLTGPVNHAGRPKIAIPANALADFHAILIDTISEAEGLDPPADDLGDDATSDPLISGKLVLGGVARGGKRVFVDVVDSRRFGRSCKVSCVDKNARFAKRATIVFPFFGLELMAQAVGEIKDRVEADAGEDASRGNGIGGEEAGVREVIAEGGKKLALESGCNRYGSYVRISDGAGAGSGSVMCPFSAIGEVIRVLEEIREAGEVTDAVEH